MNGWKIKTIYILLAYQQRLQSSTCFPSCLKHTHTFTCYFRREICQNNRIRAGRGIKPCWCLPGLHFPPFVNVAMAPLHRWVKASSASEATRVSEWRVLSRSCLQCSSACRLRQSFLLQNHFCTPQRLLVSTSNFSVLSLNEGTIRCLASNTPPPPPPRANMEKRSEYTKLEKHTENGCLKFTAVNIKFSVQEKECKRQWVNKIATDGSVLGRTRLALSELWFTEAHLHSWTKVRCWRPFLSGLLLQKAPHHPPRG